MRTTISDAFDRVMGSGFSEGVGDGFGFGLNATNSVNWQSEMGYEISSGTRGYDLGMNLGKGLGFVGSLAFEAGAIEAGGAAILKDFMGMASRFTNTPREFYNLFRNPFPAAQKARGAFSYVDQKIYINANRNRAASELAAVNAHEGYHAALNPPGWRGAVANFFYSNSAAYQMGEEFVVHTLTTGSFREAATHASGYYWKDGAVFDAGIGTIGTLGYWIAQRAARPSPTSDR
jgi:hypothetical protein